MPVYMWRYDFFFSKSSRAVMHLLHHLVVRSTSACSTSPRSQGTKDRRTFPGFGSYSYRKPSVFFIVVLSNCQRVRMSDLQKKAPRDVGLPMCGGGWLTQWSGYTSAIEEGRKIKETLTVEVTSGADAGIIYLAYVGNQPLSVASSVRHAASLSRNCRRRAALSGRNGTHLRRFLL
jgi:hypothetical protein